MRLVIQREGLCGHVINTCERCLGRVIEHPLGYDRPCVLEFEDDGSEVFTLVFHTQDGRDKIYKLTPEQQKLLPTEGWSTILDEIDSFDPESGQDL